ncbi:dynein regulatory complex protein 1-like [Syngnathus typhle]|uniref:dynein regulatory complex protein 1-like n=1 Tax=Syngnathus typhle TaxID=161592 RepID=UPI002A6ACC72|nr:dynein regulatory complex protein 1-like [Syngnathus typhle]
MQSQESGATRPESHEDPQAAAGREPMTAQRVIRLHCELLAFFTDLQTAADAKQSLRQTKFEEALRLRMERLDSSREFSTKKLEEINDGWAQSTTKTTLLDLLDSLNTQRTLCSEMLDHKMELIGELQKNWVDGDERHSIDLRKQKEALDLMIERMDKVRHMTMANKELAHIQNPHDIFLTQSLREWEGFQTELRARREEWLTQRNLAMEEYENAMPLLELAQEQCNTAKRSIDMKLMELEREQEEIKGKRNTLDARKLSCDEKPEVIYLLRKRVNTLKVQLSDIMKMIQMEVESFQRREQHLLDDIRHSMAQHKRIQKKIKHFALFDAQTFVKMSSMLEAEVKLLAESALATDSHLCSHLGLTWERPTAVIERRYPIQPQDRFEMVAQVYAESVAEVDAETMKALLGLLSDELGFLMENSEHLGFLRNERRTAEKLLGLLNAFDFYDDDLNRLAAFLLKYEEQHRERAEQKDGDPDDGDPEGSDLDSCDPASGDPDGDAPVQLIHPNNVLPAFLSFVSYRVHCMKNSALRHDLDWDDDADKAFWDSLANIIPEEKLRIWDAAEIALTKYLAVLEENSEIFRKNVTLEEENRELRRQLACETDGSAFLLKDFLEKDG